MVEDMNENIVEENQIEMVVAFAAERIECKVLEV